MKYFYAFVFYLLLGIWLLISPYVLGFTDMQGAYWNAVVAGLLSTASAAVGLYYTWGETAGRPMMHHTQKA